MLYALTRARSQGELTKHVVLQLLFSSVPTHLKHRPRHLDLIAVSQFERPAHVSRLIVLVSGGVVPDAVFIAGVRCQLPAAMVKLNHADLWGFVSQLPNLELVLLNHNPARVTRQLLQVDTRLAKSLNIEPKLWLYQKHVPYRKLFCCLNP
jgi:hypothetical protein